MKCVLLDMTSWYIVKANPVEKYRSTDWSTDWRSSRGAIPPTALPVPLELPFGGGMSVGIENKTVTSCFEKVRQL